MSKKLKEIHGLRYAGWRDTKEQSVSVYDGEGMIYIRLSDNYNPMAELDPAQARFIARQLYRAARRVEKKDEL